MERYRDDEPSWSELPIILLGSEMEHAAAYLNELDNVTLLDRPLRMAVFVAAVRSALRSRSRQYQLKDLLEQVEQSQRQQKLLLSDVLSAVTRGKLCLSDLETETEMDREPVWEMKLDALEDVPRLRERLRQVPTASEVGPDRWYNFLVAAGEASANAILHGHGGCASFFVWEDRISLRIQDQGPGIPLESLPKATLQGGYSSARTLGMGFTAIVEFVDRVRLATDLRGTTVTLEMNRKPSAPDNLAAQLLDRF
jgi:anti-sigma regulatory factor (Ser/Thr protein kinase)